MKTTKTIMAMLFAAFMGCDNSDGEYADEVSVKTNSPIRYLCVGMEQSARFGSCPGCATDAVTMRSLLRDKFGYPGFTLVSEYATKKNVVAKLKEGIEATPPEGMFLFCYSGHGGQEYLGGKEPDGSDRQDEYLCLYDTHMLDDEIWEIVSKCKGRVFLYFDACHSATMYRCVASDLRVRKEGEAFPLSLDDMIMSSGFSFTPSAMFSAKALSKDVGENSPSIICWSGCKEAEYSYGGAYGGVMTRALARNWKEGITYGSLWRKILVDVQREQPTQHPYQTKIGRGFPDNIEAFK